MVPRKFPILAAGLAALCAVGCVPLTPIRTCEHGVAAYRDSFDWQFPPYASMKVEVFMQCGIVVQGAAE